MTSKKSLGGSSPDMAALNDLLNTFNNPNIVGVETPKSRPRGEDVLAEAEALRKEAKRKADVEIAAPLPPVSETESPWIHGSSVPEELKVPATVAPLAKPAPRLLFFTGRTNVGKDHAARAAGAKIFGFAEPLYAIASHYFGVEVNATEGKDLPGMREFLQVIGQWGRRVISDKYPLTTARAMFCRMIQRDARNLEFGNQFPDVNWEGFGLDPDIWVNACVARAQAYAKENPHERVAVTNCRFEVEFKRLMAEGFQHWHVMASPKTWASRLAQQKIAVDSPALKDISEVLASNLDNNVIKQVSQQKDGPKLRCLWNDDLIPKPSARLHTLETFLQSIKGA